MTNEPVGIGATRMTQQPGRLALREEGSLWVAYYALPETMDNAIFLGSIRMAFVVGHPDRKAAFMALMKEALSDLVEESVGARLEWPNPERPAPEHERGGRG
jgi:hypothetical protein